MPDEEEANKKPAKAKAKTYAIEKLDRSAIPRELFHLPLGTKLVLKTGGARVSKVSRNGRPLEIDYGKADGSRVRGAEFVLGDYVRLK